MTDDGDVSTSLQLARLMRVMTHGLRDRIQTWAAMLLTFALFAASVWRLHWLTFAGACCFALFVTILLRGRRRDG